MNEKVKFVLSAFLMCFCNCSLVTPLHDTVEHALFLVLETESCRKDVDIFYFINSLEIMNILTALKISVLAYIYVSFILSLRLSLLISPPLSTYLYKRITVLIQQRYMCPYTL